jgi:hypothetical protein
MADNTETTTPIPKNDPISLYNALGTLEYEKTVAQFNHNSSVVFRLMMSIRWLRQTLGILNNEIIENNHKELEQIQEAYKRNVLLLPEHSSCGVECDVNKTPEHVNDTHSRVQAYLKRTAKENLV